MTSCLGIGRNYLSINKDVQRRDAYFGNEATQARAKARPIAAKTQVAPKRSSHSHVCQANGRYTPTTMPPSELSALSWFGSQILTLCLGSFDSKVSSQDGALVLVLNRRAVVSRKPFFIRVTITISPERSGSPVALRSRTIKKSPGRASRSIDVPRTS